MEKIPLFKTFNDEREMDLVSTVIRRGMNWANGREIVDFEKMISGYVGSKNCVVFNSGTSALHSVLEAYGVRDHEVIVPSFTFIATVNSVKMAGGIPVFADIEDRTFGLDPEDVNNRISKKTKAILPVHYAGCPCDIGPLKEIADDNNLLLIEDAAEALGSKRKNRMSGTFGSAAMFSFTPSKIVSTGEGGAIVTDDDQITRKLRLIRSHGRESYKNEHKKLVQEYVDHGYNFRLSSMQAAIGIAQMEKIDYLIRRRREIALSYNDRLSRSASVRTPEEPDGNYHIYQMYSILLEDRSTRDDLKDYLKENGIDSRVNFEPIHLSPYYSSTLGYEVTLPITEDVSDRILSLPIYPDLMEADIDRISCSIVDFTDK